jgi:hypothetical protein
MRSKNSRLVFACGEETALRSPLSDHNSDLPPETLSRLVRDWLAPELARQFLAARREGLDPKDNPASKETNYDTPLQGRYGFPNPMSEEAK